MITTTPTITLPSSGPAWSADLGDVPGDIEYLRITTAEPHQGEHVAGLAGYFFNGPLAIYGEFWPESVPTIGYEFIFYFDITKSARDDAYWVLTDPDTGFDVHLRDGSPLRKTGRTGPVGTRKWAGLHGPFTVQWG